MLNMDAVGLGKTLQAVGAIAVYAWLVNLTMTIPEQGGEGQLPGMFANSTEWWLTALNNGTLARPHIIVVPVSLVDQIVVELHSVGGVRPVEQPPHKRIMVVSHPTLGNTGKVVLTNTHNTPSKVPELRMGVQAEQQAAQTVFGRQWGVAVIDEIHQCRNVGQFFMGVTALTSMSIGVLGMSATPVSSKAMDLWNIGRALRINFFISNDAEARDMNRAQTRGLRKDRKKRAVDPESVTNVLRGADTDMVSEVSKEMAPYVAQMRDHFSGLVIRRTIASVDWEGKPLLTLRPYTEHIFTMRLYQHEYDALEALLACDAPAACPRLSPAISFQSANRPSLSDFEYGA
ncbi:hypothetical protein EWM64_g9596 [Hericium alpestre]|uniref:Helicase ATP-binding domain-containing protein n=1 Tax=Hericium alpestre TaxID=135208 RepID=A0A4Y9ZI46_9AGAM|nr:hypothetical protein EWM64_g9596 [Hericium alpestre]